MATIEITQENLQETITQNDIVLLDWWAEWCGPCKQFAPTYESSSDKHEDVVFGKVDTEEQQMLAASAQISSIPTLMAFREGVLVFSQAGALPDSALEQVVEAVKGLDMDEVHQQVAEQQAAGDTAQDETAQEGAAGDGAAQDGAAPTDADRA